MTSNRPPLINVVQAPNVECEDVARVQVDGSVEWNPKLTEDLPEGTKLYTIPQDQSKRIAELEATVESRKNQIIELLHKVDGLDADKLRLIEHIKKLQANVDDCIKLLEMKKGE